MINWPQVIFYVCVVLAIGVVIPLLFVVWRTLKSKLTKEQQDTINYWVAIGVRWAKQWLQNESGPVKKSQVMKYVSSKLESLGIKVSQDDLSKIIEAVYEQVKKEAASDSVLLGLPSEQPTTATPEETDEEVSFF